MALPIEELVNKISFALDLRGKKQYDNAIDGMGKRALKLGAVLAGAFAGKKALEWAMDLETAHVRSKRWSKEIGELTEDGVKLTGELGEGWETVKDAIPGTEHMRDYLNALNQFKQFHKGGTTQDFVKLFEMAGLVAKSSGGQIEDTFNALTAALTGGDLGELKKHLPDFDAFDESLQNFVLNLSRIDPSGVGNIAVNMAKMFELMGEGKPRLKAIAEEMHQTAAGQLSELGEGLEAIATDIGNVATKPLKELLGTVNEFLRSEETRKSIKTGTKAVTGFFEGFGKGGVSEVQPPTPQPGGATQTINQNINIEIKTDSPVEAGKEVNKTIRQAQNRYEPLEQ